MLLKQAFVILFVVSVLSTVSAVFLLLLVGYGARKLGVLKSSDTAVVNSIVINLTGPAFAFSALYGKPLTLQMIGAPMVIIISSMLVMGLAYIAGVILHLDRKTTGAIMLVSAFGNTGFLGYPVTMAAFPKSGDAIATAVMCDQFGMALPLYSIGVVVAASFAAAKTNRAQILEFMKAPLLPATIIAILLRPVHLPQPIVSSLTILGQATVPLAMLSLGLSLSKSSLKTATVPFTVGIVLKMVAVPIITFLGLKLVGIDGVVRNVTVLESSMPAAVMTGVIAGRYNTNGAFVSAAIFLMTLASIITIPVILMLLG
ncbi:MAG: AEC family transporter [Armatimonadota bacterium]